MTATDLDPAQPLAEMITACGTQPLDVLAPADVRRTAATLLADHAWCVTAARASGRGRGSAPPALAVDGAPERAAAQAETAPLVDLDDIHWPSLVHPGGVVWPVVVQLGCLPSIPPERWLPAAVAGYAVTIRHAVALGPEHASRFHVTATAGTVGVVATASVLLGLDADRVADAVRHAWSLLGGSRGALADPAAETRVLHRGHAVRTGLRAIAAAHGLAAPPGAAVLGSGVFPPGFASRLSTAPLTGAELAATRPRLVRVADVDADQLAAVRREDRAVDLPTLAAKWGCASALAAQLVDQLAESLVDDGPRGWADATAVFEPSLEKMAEREGRSPWVAQPNPGR